MACLVIGLAQMAQPGGSPNWVGWSVVVAAGAAALAFRRARGSGGRLRGSLGLVWPVLAVLAAMSVGLRWEAASLGRGAWLAAGAAVAVVSSQWCAERPAVIPLVGLSCLVATLAARWSDAAPGALLFHEVWATEDYGRLSPLAWRDLAAPIAAVGVPLAAMGALDAGGPGRRVAWWLLVWALLAALIASGAGLPLVCAVAGALWAAGWSGRIRWRRAAFGSLVCVALAAATVLLVLPKRDDPVRNRALREVSEAAATRAYLWDGALRAAGPSLVAGHGLGAFPRAYGLAREPRWLPAAGVDRPCTALDDACVLVVEVGLPGTLAVLGVGLYALARARRTQPAASGALLAGGLCALLVGHATAPLNGWLMLLLVGWACSGLKPTVSDRGSSGLKPTVSGERAGSGLQPTALQPTALQPTALLALGLLIVSAVLWRLGAAAPPAADGIEAAQAVRLWQEARTVEPTRALPAYERAAMAFPLRWQATRSGPPWARVTDERTVRDLYADFCRDYAAVLLAQGDSGEASGWEALADELSPPAAASPSSPAPTVEPADPAGTPTTR